MLPEIGFIGAGNLAEAVIKGLAAGQDRPRILATDYIKERLNWLADKYAVTGCGLPELVQEAKVIFLAVKPKDVPTLLQSLTDYPLQGKLVISVAAGIPLAVLEKGLPGVAVIRVMPNTSCAVLRSMTGLVQGNLATEDDKAVAEQIFRQVGQILWIPESKINAVTALSGSGPAYYYLFTECLMTAGIELGLTAEEAQVLARETMVGAGQMLTQSGKSPSRLREDVTSPNGTTYAALVEFEQAGLSSIVNKAVRAAAGRAAEMAREYSGK